MYTVGNIYPFYYIDDKKIVIKKLKYIGSNNKLLMFEDDKGHVFNGTSNYVTGGIHNLLSLSMYMTNLYRSYHKNNYIEYKEKFDNMVDTFYAEGGIVLIKDEEIICEYEPSIIE